MAIVLFDNAERKKLYPLTYTRAAADLRMGIVTIKRRWELLSGLPVYVATAAYLQGLYGNFIAGDDIWIDATVMADEILLKKIAGLQKKSAIADSKGLIAGRTTAVKSIDLLNNPNNYFEEIDNMDDVKRLEYPWEIFKWNAEMIQHDFSLLTKNRTSEPISTTNSVINEAHIFIEEGASVEHSIINATDGPVYIGKNALVMEGCLIKGPFVMNEKAVLKMGTKIYGATTLGPCCVGGGEIKGVVMQGYSNKAHDGYLGDSVIGEWCNFGAGTSNSNLKNTASDVMMYDHYTHELVNAGIKCGLIMGDYSRTAINTSINTGSLYGVCCNIFGEGLMPKLIPNFTWGIKGLTRYGFDKALQDIDNWKKFKQQSLSIEESAVLKHIFEQPAHS